MYNQFDDWSSHISKWPDGRPRRFVMPESSNPTTAAPRVRPVKSFLKKGALTFGACLAFTLPAYLGRRRLLHRAQPPSFQHAAVDTPLGPWRIPTQWCLSDLGHDR